MNEPAREHRAFPSVDEALRWAYGTLRRPILDSPSMWDAVKHGDNGPRRHNDVTEALGEWDRHGQAALILQAVERNCLHFDRHLLDWRFGKRPQSKELLAPFIARLPVVRLDKWLVADLLEVWVGRKMPAGHSLRWWARKRGETHWMLSSHRDRVFSVLDPWLEQVEARLNGPLYERGIISQ